MKLPSNVRVVVDPIDLPKWAKGSEYLSIRLTSSHARSSHRITQDRSDWPQMRPRMRILKPEFNRPLHQQELFRTHGSLDLPPADSPGENPRSTGHEECR